MPTLTMSALFTSLLGLNEMFKEVSFSSEFDMSLEKSSPFRLGKLARPSSTNSCLARYSKPAEVTSVQKLMLRVSSNLQFYSYLRQLSVMACSL